MDVDNEEEEEEEEDDDDDDDDDERTGAFLNHVPVISPNRLLAISVRPSVSQSSLRQPSRVTITYNIYNIHQSVISVDSEVTGTTINSGVHGGSSRSAEITMQHLKTDDRP